MPKVEDFAVDENKVWFTGGYWPEGVPHQLHQVEDIKVMPLHEGTKDQANKKDLWDKDVCIFVLGPYHEKFSLKKVWDMAMRFGAFLYDKLGIRKGDVIAIDVPNSPNFVVCYMGAISIGAIVAGVNPTYRPMELLHTLTITHAKVLVVMDRLYSAGPDKVLEKTEVKHMIWTDLLDFVTAPPEVFEQLRAGVPSYAHQIPESAETYGIYNLKKIIEETEPKEFDADIDPWEDPACYLMTGGTTGLPKAAVLTHANLYLDLKSMEDWTSLKAGMITIGSIPFFHSFGMTCVMNAALALGLVMLLFPKPPSDQELCETITRLDCPQGVIYVGVEMLFKRLTDYMLGMGKEQL